jgi:hypothetical protein
MSSCSLSYLGGVFDRAATISCGSDAVTDPVTGTGRIITLLPHDIAQLLTSPHLNYNHSICRKCRRRFVGVVLVVVVVVVIPSLFCENIPTWISLCLTTVFSHQGGISVFKFPKRFLEFSWTN